MEQAQKLQDKRIFISYGHDQYAPIADRLAKDLRNYVADVWFDADNIRSTSGNWPAAIEKGIEDCDLVLALMTKHAHRSPSGVCTNEIIYASTRRKEIRTVLVEQMDIPLLLCAIQYFDISDLCRDGTGQFDEQRYQERFQVLLKELASEQVDFRGYLQDIKKYLNPQDNRLEIARRSAGFVGRRWLFQTYEHWMAEGASNMLFLLGKPGSGKSSFLSKLVTEYSDIKGIHYCRYNEQSSTRTASILKTISFYLLTQLPEYADYFGDVDIRSLTDKPLDQLFDALITTPLAQIPEHQPLVLAIDAIDEMDSVERSHFIRLLLQNRNFLPKWLRFVITARTEVGLVEQLQLFQPFLLDVNCAENWEDLRTLLYAHPATQALSSEEKQQILEKSGGIIQYVRFVMDELAAGGQMEIAKLPSGLMGIYERDFQRYSAVTPYSRLQDFLELLCAAKEPLPLSLCQEICGDAVLRETLQTLGAYVLLEQDCLSFFHKSLYDWLTDSTHNLAYGVSLSQGNQRLCRWMEENCYQWQEVPYLCRHGMRHVYEAHNLPLLKQLLQEENAAISGSFLSLLLEELGEAPQPDRWLLSVLRAIQVPEIDWEGLAAQAIKLFVEHGLQDRAKDIFVRTFAGRCLWTSDYYALCVCRYEGNWAELTRLGEGLLPRIHQESLFLEIVDYLGDAYRLIGDHEHAIRYYQMAIDQTPDFLRAERCFTSLYNYLDLRYVKGFLQEAESQMKYYMEQVPNDAFKQYKANRLLGNISFQRGENEQAYAHFYQSYEFAKVIGRKQSMAEGLYSMAESLAAVDPERALSLIEESRALLSPTKDAYTYAKSFFASVERLAFLEDWQGVLREGQEAVERLEAKGYRTGVTRILRSMALAYLHLGEYEKAIAAARQPLERYQARQSYPIARLKSYWILLQAAQRLGRLEEFRNLECPDTIPNLAEFPNSKRVLEEIHGFLERR